MVGQCRTVTKRSSRDGDGLNRSNEAPKRASKTRDSSWRIGSQDRHAMAVVRGAHMHVQLSRTSSTCTASKQKQPSCHILQQRRVYRMSCCTIAVLVGAVGETAASSTAFIRYPKAEGRKKRLTKRHVKTNQPSEHVGKVGLASGQASLIPAAKAFDT